eukprot:1518760-Rhodomonas_salina.1
MTLRLSSASPGPLPSHKKHRKEGCDREGDWREARGDKGRAKILAREREREHGKQSQRRGATKRGSERKGVKEGGREAWTRLRGKEVRRVQVSGVESGRDFELSVHVCDRRGHVRGRECALGLAEFTAVLTHSQLKSAKICLTSPIF